ncbi:MAG TPA: hypothetical protein VFU02_06780, partial [Polyangiaceae bacterium]|nr:hypothetical protein [Polyangiaceae bacterium]
MSPDPLDERARELFAAARGEPAPEAARQRIAAALRAQTQRPALKTSRVVARKGTRVWLLVAAAAAVAGAMLSMQVPEDPIDISAEALAPPSTQRQTTSAHTAAPAPRLAPSSDPPPVASSPPARRAPVRAPP